MPPQPNAPLKGLSTVMLPGSLPRREERPLAMSYPPKEACISKSTWNKRTEKGKPSCSPPPQRGFSTRSVPFQYMSKASLRAVVFHRRFLFHLFYISHDTAQQQTGVKL